MTMAFTVKNKIRFIDGSIKEPYEKSLYEHEQWSRYNQAVKTWLLGSMSKEIAGSVIRVAIEAFTGGHVYFILFHKTKGFMERV